MSFTADWELRLDYPNCSFTLFPIPWIIHHTFPWSLLLVQTWVPPKKKWHSKQLCKVKPSGNSIRALIIFLGFLFVCLAKKTKVHCWGTLSHLEARAKHFLVLLYWSTLTSFVQASSSSIPQRSIENSSIFYHTKYSNINWQPMSQI